MANVQSMCTSFKQDLLNGLHAFGNSVVRGTTTPDSFKAALYLASASLGASTTVYSSTGEVTGTNYVAGGVNITMGNTPATTGATAFITPSTSIVYTNITVGANFDAVLIYNNTASAKNAVSVHTFTPQTITAGTLTLTMPTNDSTSALIRLT